MKFSQIITQYFNIGLDLDKQQKLDEHFVGAAHAYYRHREACDLALEHADYYQRYLGYHLRALMTIVTSGEFSQADDPSLQGLCEPEGWSADLKPYPIPLEELFGRMLPDCRWGLGIPHPYDQLITDFRAPVEKHRELPNGTWRMRLVAHG